MVSNIEPSGDQEFDFGTFLEDDEVRKAFTKLVAFVIEGSSLELKELRLACYHEITTIHFPDLSSYMNDTHFEEVITKSAFRKSYGVKPKNALIYYDTTPTALWCWEI